MIGTSLAVIRAIRHNNSWSPRELEFPNLRQLCVQCAYDVEERYVKLDLIFQSERVSH